MLATCIQRGGLTVALSRIVAAGRSSDDVKRSDTTHRGGLRPSARRDGSGSDAEANSSAVAQQAPTRRSAFAGEETRHHQGGAIGYRSREWVAHPASEEQVQPRQAFAWNPSITGTKIEDTALLTENGTRIDYDESRLADAGTARRTS